MAYVKIEPINDIVLILSDSNDDVCRVVIFFNTSFPFRTGTSFLFLQMFIKPLTVCYE